MFNTQGLRFIPMGCSCFNQFQLEKCFAEGAPRRGLFDWNITTPKSTAEIFDAAADGSLEARLLDGDAYDYVTDGEGEARLRNRHFAGFYLWHAHPPSDERLDRHVRSMAFASKLRWIWKSTFAERENCVLVWSNIQPNLRLTTRGTPSAWEDFHLTVDRYMAIKHRAEASYFAPKYRFFVRSDAVAAELLDADDVEVIDLEEKNNLSGHSGLYRPYLKQLLREGEEVVSAVA